jgi:hypothetical protein
MHPIIKFPYKIYKNVACPIISIGIKGHRSWLLTEAYIDSGASISVFLDKIARDLEIDYLKGKTIYTTVGDGSLIPVYLHKLPVRIGNISFEATIGFSPRLGIGFNLLGRQDIFNRFDITFSDSQKTISFLPLHK